MSEETFTYSSLALLSCFHLSTVYDHFYTCVVLQDFCSRREIWLQQIYKTDLGCGSDKDIGAERSLGSALDLCCIVDSGEVWRTIRLLHYGLLVSSAVFF